MKKFSGKIVLVLILVLMLVLVQAISVQAEDPIDGVLSDYYSDVDSNLFFFDSIEFISGKKIVKGYDDGTFMPGKLLNRAELLKILIEAKYDRSQFDSYYDQSCFKDVKADAWYTKYVCFGKHAGIVEGYSDGTFKPGQTVNLVEALKMALTTFSYSYAIKEGDPWYKNLVDSAAMNNFIPLTFTDFGQEVERAEMADLIARILKHEEGSLDEFLGDDKDKKVDYNSLKNHVLVLGGGDGGNGGNGGNADEDIISKVCGTDNVDNTPGGDTYYCNEAKKKIYNCKYVTMVTYGTESFLQCFMYHLNGADVLVYSGGLLDGGWNLMREKDDESDEVVSIKSPIELLYYWGSIDSAESAKWFAVAATGDSVLDVDQSFQDVFGDSFVLEVPFDEVLYTVVKKSGNQYEVPLYFEQVFGCSEFSVTQYVYIVSDNGIALKESKKIGHTSKQGLCVD